MRPCLSYGPAVGCARAAREYLLLVRAGAGCRRLDVESVGGARSALASAGRGMGLAGEQDFFDFGHGGTPFLSWLGRQRSGS